MKRLITAAFAALIILSGCEYHPYYDGQEFFVYNSEYGVLDRDGSHMYIPIADDDSFVLEFYGGKGEEHLVEIADPEILRYAYTESDVKTTVGDYEIIPAHITLIPEKMGDTSIKVTDSDTGESVQIYIHICEAMKAIQVYKGGEVIPEETVFAFRYPAEDDVVWICHGNVERNEIEHISDGTYKFFDIEGLLYFEINFPADENGRPAAEGKMSRKLYQVQFAFGGSYDSDSMMLKLNLDTYPVHTKASRHTQFMFVDVTDKDPSSMDSIDTDVFYANSARFIRIIEE